MNLSTELTKQVTAHLDEVRKYLWALPADERQEILQSIESHIYDALETRSDGEPTPALLDAVIAEMDPPESYGELPTVTPNKPKLGRLSPIVFGAALIAILVGLYLAKAQTENSPISSESTLESEPLIIEGVGWRDYLLGKTSIELTEALGEPQANTPEWMMRWDKHPYVYIALSAANACKDVRFNRGFKGRTSAGIKIGSSFEKMLAAYGDAETIWARETDPCVIAEWPGKGIHIYTYKGLVSQIIIHQPKPKYTHPFKDDPSVHGQWVSIDFVNSINAFQPGKQPQESDLLLKELTFFSNGATSHAWTWTQGRLIGQNNTSRYTIKEIGGEKLLFLQWMSGDVTLRGQPPKYYVLKRATSKEEQTPQLKPAAFEQGLNSLENEDSIILNEVLATSPSFAIGDTVTAKGQYTLASQLNARILLTVTATRGSGRSNVEKEQEMKMALGSGEFELTYTIPFHGCSQLSFRDEITGESLGGLYFGTKQQVNEMKSLKKTRSPKRKKKPTVESPEEKSKSINLTSLPSKADMGEISEMQKAAARDRMYEDQDIYSRDELREIETLYQVANKKWRSEEGKDSLKELISKYSSANRTGCALLYLGQQSTGDEQVEYLQRAIDDFSDCFYGDGVQVGAYARFVLFHRYKRDGENEKAAKLADEIKTLYPDSISHRKQSLVALLTASTLAENSSGIYSLSFENEPIATVLAHYCKVIGRSLLMSTDIPDRKITLRAKSLTKNELISAIEEAMKLQDIDINFLGDKYVKVTLRK